MGYRRFTTWVRYRWKAPPRPKSVHSADIARDDLTYGVSPDDEVQPWQAGEAVQPELQYSSFPLLEELAEAFRHLHAHCRVGIPQEGVVLEMSNRPNYLMTVI